MAAKFCISFFVVAALLCHVIDADNSVQKENLQTTPATLDPLTYSLIFDVNTSHEENLFTGSTIIKAQCIAKTSAIILNVKDLEIAKDKVQVLQELSVDGVETKELPISKGLDEDKEKELLIIKLDQPLEKNSVIRVRIDYKKRKPADEKEDLAFIIRSYKDFDGKERLFAVTQSGPINARRLFPCLDEVDLKTEFNLEISHNEDVIGITNTHRDENATENDSARQNLVSERFKKTVPLSTFSVGFVVGKFESITEVEDPVQIWVKERKLGDQMEYIRPAVEKILEFYNTYFDTSVVEPQLNIVALPNYGTIDKWKFGLITMDESMITNSNPKNEIKTMEIALQLCDAIGHQYFGPQTTLSTWSENWLNMGFAQYFRIPCLHEFFKENAARLANIKLVESFITVMDIDAEIKSRPVMRPDDDRINLSNFFGDTLLTETAHFYVRMMNYFLGEEQLRECVQKYLTDYRLKVTNLENIWNIFSSEIENIKMSLPKDKTLKDVMDSWMYESGYPKIYMTRDLQEQVVTITQASSDKSDAEADALRIIPLRFLAKSQSRGDFDREKSTRYWLQSEPIKISVKNEEWLVLDLDLEVLLRVHYDPETLGLIYFTLFDKNHYDMIPIMSRTQFLSDIFAFAWMGDREISYAYVLRIITYLSYEESYQPMMVAFHELIKIRSALFGTEVFPEFQKHVQKILKPIFEKFSNIDQLTLSDYKEYFTKKLVFSTSCLFGVQSCVKKSIEMFQNWVREEDYKTKNPIPEGLREIVYCQAIKEESDSNKNEKWDALWKLYNRRKPQNSDDILNALGCSSNKEILRVFLLWSASRTRIAPENSLTVFKSVASNQIGYSIATKFVREYIDKIIKRVYRNEKNSSNVYHYLEILYEITWRKEHLDELNSIVETTKDRWKNIETHLAESKKKAERNIVWLTNNEKKFPEYLENSNFFDEKHASLTKESEATTQMEDDDEDFDEDDDEARV